ncbi:MAG: hypothetical protein AB7P22_07515 [Vicinamibacterales bacterium]
MAGFTLVSMLDSDASGVLNELVSARIAERDLAPLFFNARFDVRVQSVYTITLGAVAVIFALILQLLFRKSNRPCGAQLIFAVHYISFIYLLTVARRRQPHDGLSTDAAASAGYAVILPCLILGLKRVYAQSASISLAKAAVLLLLTVALNSLANFAAIRVTLAFV